MSQSAYEKYIDQLKPEGILLFDEDLVRLKTKYDDHFSIPATRMAEEMGRKMMANIIMIGFLTAVTRVVSKDAAVKSIASSVPKTTIEQNIEAFQKGFDNGLAILKGREKKALGRTGAIE
jgi:2-oxoglutarate ferredoxin oxidoreductase subunit gamma